MISKLYKLAKIHEKTSIPKFYAELNSTLYMFAKNSQEFEISRRISKRWKAKQFISHLAFEYLNIPKLKSLESRLYFATKL